MPRMDVREFEGDVDTMLGSERPRLRLGRGREVDRQYIEALFGKPHAIAALAISYGQSSALRRQQRFAGDEKIIRLLAEGIVRDAKPGFPALVLAHVAWLQCAQTGRSIVRPAQGGRPGSFCETVLNGPCQVRLA